MEQPKRPNWLIVAVAALVGIIGLWTMLSNVGFGLILVVLSLFYFYALYRVRTSPSPKLWHSIGTFIGGLFVVGGFILIGLAVLFMIALASWGSGGGGSGK